ncbi:S-layer homology domain-containing protein [Neobacillus sp. D3-1R]|uniref:S-layer homology domain-containing protein n=1 Tax=Neobacillus sp. D3-1R TaxID=3445778 RepID=UPI003FA08EC6
MKKLLTYFTSFMLLFSFVATFEKSVTAAENKEIWEKESNNSTVNATVVDYDYQTTIRGQISDLNDYDYFKVKVKHGVLNIKTKGWDNVKYPMGFKMNIIKQEDNAFTLYSSKDDFGSSMVTGEEAYSISLEKGDYYLEVHPMSYPGVNYSISITDHEDSEFELENNNSEAKANIISKINQKTSGYIHYGDVDYFTFTSPSSAKSNMIELSFMENLPDGTNLEIYDKEGYEYTYSKFEGKSSDGDLNIYSIDLPEDTDFYIKVSGTPYIGPTYFYQFGLFEKSFRDLAPKHWAYMDIEKLSSLGVIKGMANGTFKAEMNVKRSQAAVMIARQLKLNLNNRPNPNFKDVPSTYWAYKEIAALVDEGILPKQTRFNPDSPLTREGMAQILVRAYHLKDYTEKIAIPKDYTDVAKTNAYYQDIKIISTLGITSGYADGSFKPKKAVTRAQFSAFISRTLFYVDRDFVIKQVLKQ